MFSNKTTSETKVTPSQNSTSLVAPNTHMSTNQSLSAGGSTPSLSGTSEHANENVPVNVMGMRAMPPGSVPPGFVQHQMMDPGVMSQQVCNSVVDLS